MPGRPLTTGHADPLEDRAAASAFPSEKEFPFGEGLSADTRALLLHLSQIFHSTSDLDVLLELICYQTLRRIPAVSFRIALTEENADALSYAYYSENGIRRSDREGIPFPLSEDLAGRVVGSGQPLVMEDYSEACRADGLPEREPAMGLPRAWVRWSSSLS